MLIVDLGDRSRHRIRVEMRILRAVKNDIYAIAAEQQGKGNIPGARIINVRHARADE